MSPRLTTSLQTATTRRLGWDMVQCIGIFFEMTMPAPRIYATLAEKNVMSLVNFIGWLELCHEKG